MTFEEAVAILVVDNDDEYVDQGGGSGYYASHRTPANLPKGWRIVDRETDQREILQAPDSSYWCRWWESSPMYGWEDCSVQGPLEEYQEPEPVEDTGGGGYRGRW